jgi:2-polyprenyl-3-methyl-5-hydroxy-6-metoxy-1,4-benzoquinol methylase
MPTIEFNKQLWGEEYAWPRGGDGWSKPWGGTEAQWYGSVLPRIHAFVPAGTILEIAPGFGRWTQYLKGLCQHLVVVDLNENCIERCKERFASSTDISYYVNDGTSLEMIPDNSIDFAFCFDSLVHVEIQVLEAYVTQLASKLTQNGAGFFHHSNIGEYQRTWKYQNRIPQTIRRYLTRKKVLTDHHLRAFSVTAAKFAEICDAAGLCCITQELVNWRQRLLIDAFSVFTHKGSKWARPNKVFNNHSFMKEVEQISKLSDLYYFSGAN